MGEGLYTDMNAIRRDEELDNLHSVYVDQWDWEKVIPREDRTETICARRCAPLSARLRDPDDPASAFPQLRPAQLAGEVTFITTQELEDLYPT